MTSFGWSFVCAATWRMPLSTSSGETVMCALSAAPSSRRSSMRRFRSSRNISLSCAACCVGFGVLAAMRQRCGRPRRRSSESRIGRSPTTATMRSTIEASAGRPPPMPTRSAAPASRRPILELTASESRPFLITSGARGKGSILAVFTKERMGMLSARLGTFAIACALTLGAATGTLGCKKLLKGKKGSADAGKTTTSRPTRRRTTSTSRCSTSSTRTSSA